MAGTESSQMPVDDEALPAQAIPSSSTAPAGPGRAAPDAHAARGDETRKQGTGATKDRVCPGCKSTGARNLVVCIDGTSNQFSTKNTNVVELYSRLIKDENQLTFYNSGIGTYAKPSWKSWSYRKQVIANKLDLAFALRLEKIIISAYAWLVDHYQPGDRIFLFGFSRGAYQVRALAAMIDIVGLLHKGNNDQIAFAYELYAASGAKEHQTAQPPQSSASLRSRFVHTVRSLASRVLPRAETWVADRDDSDLPPVGEQIRSAARVLASRVLPQREKPWPKFPQPKRIEPRIAEQTRDGPMAMQKQFKRTFSRDVHVHFVGAWDTVSSVGLVRDKTLPATTEGMKFVCFFRHALALHEYRVKFLPEYANGGDGPDEQETHRNGTAEPHTKEVWFTGSHSDIGGGSTANTTLDKFGPALRWMSWEATLAGLILDNNPTRWEQMGVSSSMTAVWRILECLPIQQLSYKHPRKKRQWFPARTSIMQDTSLMKQQVTHRPHFSANRCIKPGQRIHRSVYDECDNFEQPELVEIEPDDYIEATDLLRPLEEVLRAGYVFDEQNKRRLELLTSSAQGIRSLSELHLFQYIYNLSQSRRNSKVDARILEDLRFLYNAYVKGLFRDDRYAGPVDTTTELPLLPSETFPFHMCGHVDCVTSVAFLSDDRVVSGSYDKTLRVWDVSTGDMTVGPLSGHIDEINCVAVHADKGLVASASDDSTISLWTSDSNGAVHAGKVLQDGSSGWVLAVAFSPDGSHLVSGSEDGAIRVWDAATGERVGEPVLGHTNWVWSVAFSSDGKRIASGSSDSTVRLWEWSSDEASLQPCGEPLNGHTDAVVSVAFSPDDSVIASGSGDSTVRIWDAVSRTSKFTLRGHTSVVFSVAFAPGGTHVVSGSSDWTVRIWDVCSGAAVRVLRGHTGGVNSVAFSPDGTRIASCSDDKTVRVRDFVLPPDDSHPDEDV